MTTQTALYAAIYTEVKAFATTNGLPVKYPSKKFDTPDSGNWLELSVNPNDIDPDLSGGRQLRRGMFQLNVCGKPNKSPLTLSGIADQIRVSFFKTKTIIDSVIVSDSPYESGMIELEDRVILPVTINYSE
jgi:hypothetical protein